METLPSATKKRKRTVLKTKAKMMRHESLFWLYIINDIEQKAEHFPDGMFNRNINVFLA